MSEDQWVKLIEVLIWPATALILLLLLRNAVTGAIGRLKGVEGPAGWKLLFEVKKVRASFRKTTICEMPMESLGQKLLSC